ncbi:hypothetical protein E2F47_01995 [Mycobacterium eburneum]|nr:hypothetical protein [Mycobacterium eburneum]TDH57562.1 hypothetical protein E2F47_01995 [Mycobacterium eburneum]
MSSIKLPFAPSKAAQAVVAVLSAIGAAGTAILHDTSGVLPPNWATTITSVLAVIAAVSGFLQKAEPLIDDFDKFAE